jgi:hypothetical protein
MVNMWDEQIENIIEEIINLGILWKIMNYN